jgi:hypothetical protein
MLQNEFPQIPALTFAIDDSQPVRSNVKITQGIDRCNIGKGGNPKMFAWWICLRTA